MRRVTRSLLKGIGYLNVQEADNGESAMEWLKCAPFDAVITDWYMPVMDGVQLLEFVPGTSNISKLPVLMMTSEWAREKILQAAQMGANGYVVKPLSPAILEQKLAMIFASSPTSP